MNRSRTLSLVAWVATFLLAMYFAPLAVMAVCFELGWHAA